MHRNHEHVDLALLQAVAPDGLTLKELTHRFNDATGYAVPDASLCQPLNLLKLKGKVTATPARSGVVESTEL